MGFHGGAIMTDLRQTSQQAPEALAQEKREPVAIVEGVVPHLEVIIIKHILGARFPKIGDFLYTTPPRRKWQWLSEGEVASCWAKGFEACKDQTVGDLQMHIARAVEAALKEKNHD